MAHLTCAARLAFRPETAGRFRRAEAADVHTLGSSRLDLPAEQEPGTYDRDLIPVQRFGSRPTFAEQPVVGGDGERLAWRIGLLASPW